MSEIKDIVPGDRFYEIAKTLTCNTCACIDRHHKIAKELYEAYNQGLLKAREAKP